MTAKQRARWSRGVSRRAAAAERQSRMLEMHAEYRANWQREFTIVPSPEDLVDDDDLEAAAADLGIDLTGVRAS